MAQRRVHVVGTGTIGEPIIGLLAQHRRELGIDEVTFAKFSPRAADRPMVKALRDLGARLAVAPEKRAEFEKAGMAPDLTTGEALDAARVVLDATPEDVGLENKEKIYRKLDDGSRVFAAQGSEDGFGKKWALGINDDVVDPKTERFVHVVSCNTHSISVLVKAIGFQNGPRPAFREARFVCIRRAGDIGDKKFIQAPSVDKHKEALGTHHATDVADVYRTLGFDLDLFSSAMKVNTPYMHTIWFDFRLQEPTTRARVLEQLQANKYVGLTEKDATNTVFSFAREHGPFGRILSQTVVAAPTIHVRGDGKEITGFAFTPQDGNALLTNVALAARALHPDDWLKRIETFDKYLLKEY